VDEGIKMIPIKGNIREKCKYCGKVLGKQRVKDGIDWCETCVRKPPKEHKFNKDAIHGNKNTGLRVTSQYREG
jgi:hypothetical protein